MYVLCDSECVGGPAGVRVCVCVTVSVSVDLLVGGGERTIDDDHASQSEDNNVEYSSVHSPSIHVQAADDERAPASSSSSSSSSSRAVLLAYRIMYYPTFDWYAFPSDSASEAAMLPPHLTALSSRPDDAIIHGVVASALRARFTLTYSTQHITARSQVHTHSHTHTPLHSFY